MCVCECAVKLKLHLWQCLSPCRRERDDPGGGGQSCGRCVSYGQPGCLSVSMAGRRPSSRSYARGRHPHRHGSQGSRSRPTSPLLQSQPSSPSVYSSIPSGYSQPVFMCPSPVAVPGTAIVGVPYQPAPSTNTHQLSTMMSHISFVESPTSYQQQTGTYATYIPMVQGYQPPVYPSLQFTNAPGTQYPSNYYLGSPYIHQSGLKDSQAATPDHSHQSDSVSHCSVDVEDISLKPCGPSSTRLRPLRTQESTESVTSVSETSSIKSDTSVTPSLRLSVSSLPSPLDVPGIPIQDEVCPFHERQSEWLATTLSVYSVVLYVV